MLGKKGRACVKVSAFEYMEIGEEKIEFGSRREELEALLGKGEEKEKAEDFCEHLGDIRLEFCDGRFSAAVVPKGYDIFLNGTEPFFSAEDAENTLSRFFPPVTRLNKKESVCCEGAGIICFKGGSPRIFICSREFYRRYSAMLSVMEQCEQKGSFNDV